MRRVRAGSGVVENSRAPAAAAGTAPIAKTPTSRRPTWRRLNHALVLAGPHGRAADTVETWDDELGVRTS
ncbi:hypothetical protein [Streptomyces sp. NRRL B-3648]|uniref:hypothetical protein n=1 Tax=Streptomyces sp. NRRL B-3648 TaxID=1519493 RepID=UPI000AC77E3D